jgi:Dipeptidyl aminopeptidases/acylaminoacyl-peptidases
MARKRTRNCSYHTKPPPSRTRRFCSSTAALKDRCFWGSIPNRSYSWIYAFNQYLVAEGYIVLSVNYRGGTGYGLDYREADNLGPGGSSELNDLVGAITYLRGRQDVDSHRLGIWGPSYGGLMTALGLARASDAFAAGVDYAGIHNWSTFLSSVGDPIDGRDANRQAVESSPIATIDQWHSPVLLVQADNDALYHPSRPPNSSKA